jgi:3'(2'), 5'-bisphosphate nucleotidase
VTGADPATLPAHVAADDGALARHLAAEAGAALLALRASGAERAPADLRDAGDAQAHDVLVRLLAAYRPEDSVLSEEGRDDLARLEADRVWIVDPLDGTREYGEPGRDDWAVHVALWTRTSPQGEGRLTAGSIALPARGVVLGADDPPAPMPASGGPLRMAVSRTRPPAVLGHLAGSLDLELHPMGSAGVKIAAVLLGEVDAYVHAGGQYEWDSAAPVAVALAAGFHASRLDGRPLIYNQRDPSLPDLVVCRPELAPTLLAALATAGE